MTEANCNLYGHCYIIGKYLPESVKEVFSKSKDFEAQLKAHIELNAFWSKILASKPKKQEFWRLKKLEKGRFRINKNTAYSMEAQLIIHFLHNWKKIKHKHNAHLKILKNFQEYIEWSWQVCKFTKIYSFVDFIFPEC